MHSHLNIKFAVLHQNSFKKYLWSFDSCKESSLVHSNLISLLAFTHRMVTESPPRRCGIRGKTLTRLSDTEIKLSKPSVFYTYNQVFNIHKFYIVLALC